MNPDLNPAAALAEIEATGETAEIFADIRSVMRIPLVTSIWRVLAGVPGGLAPTWQAVRPVMASIQIDSLLQELDTTLPPPIPAPLDREELATAGIGLSDRYEVSSIVDAYNRSNCLNLIGITALLRGPQEVSIDPPPSLEHRLWPTLKPLPIQSGISAEHWTLLEQTTKIGAKVQNPHIPTIWRHLIHWPKLLRLIVNRYQTDEMSTSLITAVDEVTDWVETRAPGISHHVDRSVDIPPNVLPLLHDYVGPQPSVARMSTVGRSASLWLKSSHWD